MKVGRDVRPDILRLTCVKHPTSLKIPLTFQAGHLGRHLAPIPRDEYYKHVGQVIDETGQRGIT